MGWSNQHSEHAPDGKVVMEAIMRPGWLGNYRNFKYPFVGRPATVPDISSSAYGAKNDTSETQVHASWNGATEVRSWRLLKTTATNATMEVVDTADRTGFETLLTCPGYASYVYVEALDVNGTVLGRSGVVKTTTHPNITYSAVQEEKAWQQAAAKDAKLRRAPRRVRTWVLFTGGVLLGATLAALLVPVLSRGLLRTQYEAVPEKDVERDTDEDEQAARRSRKNKSEQDYDDDAAANTFDRAYR